jgi:hypothetical protein
VLSVDLDQRLPELLGDGERGVRVVEEDPAAAGPHQLAPHDQLAVLDGEPVGLEESRDGALPGDGEDRHDRRALGASPDRLGRLGALAEEERGGVDRDRLPAPVSLVRMLSPGARGS